MFGGGRPLLMETSEGLVNYLITYLHCIIEGKPEQALRPSSQPRLEVVRTFRLAGGQWRAGPEPSLRGWERGVTVSQSLAVVWGCLSVLRSQHTDIRRPWHGTFAFARSVLCEVPGRCSV